MPRKRRIRNTREENKCTMCGSVVAERRQKHERHRHIPGYIYDSEKKKYFRITNDCQHNQTPQKQEADKGPKICKKCSINKPSRLNKNKRRDTSFVQFIFSRQYQQMDPLVSQSKMMERLVQQYDIRHSTKLHLTHVDAIDFAVSIIQPDLRQQNILTLYKTNGSGDPIVQFHQLSKDRSQKMSLVPGSAMMKDQLVTSLNWSPHQKTSNFFLITLLGQADKWGEGLLFQVDGLMQRFVGRYPMNRHSVWTSAWNRNPLYDNIISLGASNLALTFDVNTRRRLLRFISNSDTFAQQFASKSPVIFNGFRNGDIKSADIRLCESRFPCLYISQPTPITCLKLLQDETYLMTSGMDDSIRRWDLRMQRLVQEYRGHVNQNTFRLPFFVDPTDSLLFAAGEDSLTRVWSLRSGEIVRTIPYPISESKQINSIPAICYGDEWGGPGGLPGLMYGTNDNVRFYAT